VSQGVTAWLHSCLFTGNTAVDGAQPGAMLSGQASASAVSNPNGPVSATAGGYKLEGCVLTNNSMPRSEIILQVPEGLQSPLIYSDSSDLQACTALAQCQNCLVTQSPCANVTIHPALDAPAGMFLSPDSAQLLELQQV
jgi:hypothetical protein